MKHKYKFSVIIPIYNVEEYLEKTIKSVINQTIGFKDNIQIILVNDESPDNSEKICLKYTKKYPNNIIYLKQKNGGVSAARNNGFKYAEGKYINFLDSDDLWTKNTFKDVWNFFEANEDKIDVVACRLKFFGLKENYQILDYKFDKEKIVDIHNDYDYIILSAPSTFMKYDVIKEMKFDEKLKYGEDALFLNKVILEKCKYGILPQAIYLYRKRLNETSAVDTATTKKHYYNESLDNYIDAIIEYSKRKVGYVCKFIQSLVLYDLMWRFKATVSTEVLDTPEKKQKYFCRLKNIIKKIDDKVIAKLPIMSDSYKLYFLEIKHGKKVYDNIRIKNNDMYYENLKINYTMPRFVSYQKVRVEKDRTILHAKISFINANKDFKFYVKDITTGKKYYPSITRVKNWDLVSCTGETVEKAFLYRLELPRDNNYILEHNIIYNKNKLVSAFGTRMLYFLSPNYKSYLTFNNSICLTRSKENLSIHNYNPFFAFKLYIICLFDLLIKKKLRTFIKAALRPFKKIIIHFFGISFLKKIILLESNPDYSGNTKDLFDQLIKNKVNEKYKIVWLIDKDNANNFRNIFIKNVEFLPFFDLKAKQRSKYTNYCYKHAKIIIDSNKYVNKKSPKQIRIHLNHGSPFKNAISYNINIGNVDYDICQSSFFRKVESKIRDIPIEKVIPLGFPRNDILYSNDKIKFEKFDALNANKIILWLPTYRNHNKLKNGDSKLKYGLACINNEKELLKTNEKLKNENSYLVIKFHPAEDIASFEKLNLSNILILKDSEIEEANLGLYQLFGKVDALITDYSSVYFDFVLTKKNIGLAISDFDEYIKKQGSFQYDYNKIIKGNYMYNNKDLIEFIDDVVNNRDKTYRERLKLIKKYDDYGDGKAAERIYDFIKKFL